MRNLSFKLLLINPGIVVQFSFKAVDGEDGREIDNADEYQSYAHAEAEGFAADSGNAEREEAEYCGRDAEDEVCPPEFETYLFVVKGAYGEVGSLNDEEEGKYDGHNGRQGKVVPEEKYTYDNLKDR